MTKWLLALAVALLAGSASPDARADLYRWTDAQGGIHIGDRPPSDAADVLAPGRGPAESPNDLAPGRSGRGPASPNSAHAEGGRFSKGLLWMVESTPGVGVGAGPARPSPAYLFGTIHVGDPRVLSLPAEVQQAFDASRTFCMEVVLDFGAILQGALNMVYTDGRTLQSVIGKDLFDQVAPRLAARGLPAEFLDSFKPWTVLMILSLPEQMTGEGLDLVLYQAAVESGKETCGLESVDEQTSLFEKIPERDQVLMLREALKNYDATQRLMKQTIERYLARDLGGLLRLSQEEPSADPEQKRISAAFLGRALDDRNKKMADRMEARLRQGNAFVAIGAAHLPGQRGILALLEERGFKVTPVY